MASTTENRTRRDEIHTQDEHGLMRRCPWFSSCSVADCPLYWVQGVLKDNGREKCRARPSTRLAIVARARVDGVHFELPLGGLTRAEHGKELRSVKAKDRFASLSPEERSKVTARLSGGKRVDKVGRQPEPC